MKGDFHVRFRGNAGVKFPCVTRLPASVGRQCVKTAFDLHLQQRGKTLAKPLEREKSKNLP